jgi:inhibitor of cysteine peptidase
MAEIVLSKADSGKTIELRRGDALAVHLEENPTTGFQWAGAESQSSVLSLRGSDWRPEGIAIGAGGIRVIRFEATQAGDMQIVLRLIQEWEPDEVDREFQVHVHVTGDD